MPNRYKKHKASRVPESTCLPYILAAPPFPFKVLRNLVATFIYTIKQHLVLFHKLFNFLINDVHASYGYAGARSSGALLRTLLSKDSAAQLPTFLLVAFRLLLGALAPSTKRWGVL